MPRCCSSCCQDARREGSAALPHRPRWNPRASRLSPNDIAILFHLPLIQETYEKDKKEEDISTLLKTWLVPAVAQGYSILPPDSISAMLSQFSWPDNNDVAAIRDGLSKEDTWHMTSLRVGCLNMRTSDNDECRMSLRLVLQPVQWSRNLLTFSKTNTRAPLNNSFIRREDPLPTPDNAITTEDAAIHLFYEPKQDRSRLLINSMRDFAQLVRTSYGIDTTKYLLGVHPALEPGRLDSAQRQDFLLKITAILKDFAKFDDLHSAEVMVTSGVAPTMPLPTTWSFGTFRRDSKNQLSHAPIGRGVKPHHAGEVVRSQSLSFTVGYVPHLVDKEKSFFDIVDNWRRKANWDVASTVVLQEKYTPINKIAAYVDDPRNISILMGDCVTCHVSSTLRNLSMHPKAKGASFEIEDQAERVKKYKQHLFSAYPSALPPEVEALSEVSVVPVVPDYNLHQFSYFLHRPSISKRAANDVAFDVLYFNRMLSKEF